MSRVNDGSRPSRLAIGRHLAGEVELSASALQTPSSQAWIAAVADANPPVFDAAALRARAERRPAEEAPVDAAGQNAGSQAPLRATVTPIFARFSRPAWARRGLQVASIGLAIAAALVLFVRPPEGSANRVKGGADLDFYMLRDGESLPGDEARPVRSGDQIQFSYRGASDQLVIIGVDGEGSVVPYYPDEGDAPLSIVPGERRMLEGSLLLDDAPGPEVFVAFFGEDSVAEAVSATQKAFARGGVDGVRELDEANEDIAILVLDKE